ncbi:hypothetical protein GCM10009765_06780 [Fodinicola feengrottensis]|uniref:ATP synthase subunit I n=1 Tax=Fodinicola feengrottensis TaxID=435914 RepID=A0ABN2FUR9_9ACTN
MDNKTPIEPPPDAAEALALAVPAIPHHTARNLRIGAIVAIPIGGIALAVLSVVGHPVAGLLVMLGLALGALNTHLTQRAVVQYAKGGELVAKKQFMVSALTRIGLITVLGIGPVLLLRPDGLGVICGLAVFQVIMLIVASMPLIKEYRRA